VPQPSFDPTAIPWPVPPGAQSCGFTPGLPTDELSEEQKAILFGHIARNIDSCRRAADILRLEDFLPVDQPMKLLWAILSQYVAKNSSLPSSALIHADCAQRTKCALEYSQQSGVGSADAAHTFIDAAFDAPETTWAYCKPLLKRWIDERRVKPLLDRYKIFADLSTRAPLQNALAAIESIENDDAVPATIRSMKSIIAEFPRLRQPVIQGLLREGENMNVIAPPKVGKSWLTIDLALSVALGQPWLGFDTVGGPVLIIDNELHLETIADRLPRVANKKGISAQDYDEKIHYLSLRGKRVDIHGLKPLLQSRQGQYKLIVVDAFYRLLPEGTDENDNGAMTAIFNQIDALAEHLKSAFVLIHHTSKGMQGGRAVTDVGSGAGAISRATDEHLVMRSHNEAGAVVLEAAPRSWPKVAPICLRYNYPTWSLAPDLDPTQIKKPGSKSKNESAVGPKMPTTSQRFSQFTKQEFLDAFVTNTPRSKQAILEQANQQERISERRASGFLKLLEDEKKIVRVNGAGGRAPTFARARPIDSHSGMMEPNCVSPTPDTRTPCTQTPPL
jgi:hypothetical protein